MVSGTAGVGIGVNGNNCVGLVLIATIVWF